MRRERLACAFGKQGRIKRRGQVESDVHSYVLRHDWTMHEIGAICVLPLPELTEHGSLALPGSLPRQAGA